MIAAWALLLPAAWLAIFLIFRELSARGRIVADWRISFLLASASWGALLTFGMEILSLGTLINAPALRIFWLAANAGLWGGLYAWRRRTPKDNAHGVFNGELKLMRAWPLDAKIMLGGALLFAAFLGGIALLTPTTNWDSLTYHLPRVMQWMQNRSVAHFPTNAAGQIQMGPWPAFVQTHLWLLSGGDQFENLVQWSAMLGSLVTATWLAGRLLPAEATAAAPRAQAFAALLVVTLPTGIVQAISTQSDFVTGFWLMAVAALALEWNGQPQNRIYAAGFGAALGLGVLTKFTMILFGAPVGLAAALALLWKQRDCLLRVAIPAALALAVCVALALPHFARNQAVFASVVGSKGAVEGTGIPRVTISGTVFNMLHNAELHSDTGIEPLTHQINGLIHVLEHWTGWASDDPLLSIKSSLYEAPDEFFVDDSFAASAWQVSLICLAAVIGLTSARKNRLPLLGLGLALAGYALFCAALRWQMWNSRYHLPVLVFCLPLTAAILVPLFPRWLVWTLAAGLAVFGMVIVANNRSRPIFNAAWREQTRMQKLFSFQGVRYYAPMRGMTREIMASGCQEVGLKLWPDTPEYPLWLMLREAGFTGRIDQVLVEGPSARLPSAAGRPDVIITSPPAGRPVGDLAVEYPTATEISGVGVDGQTNLFFTLYWSKKISEQRAKGTK